MSVFEVFVFGYDLGVVYEGVLECEVFVGLYG